MKTACRLHIYFKHYSHVTAVVRFSLYLSLSLSFTSFVHRRLYFVTCGCVPGPSLTSPVQRVALAGRSEHFVQGLERFLS